MKAISSSLVILVMGVLSLSPAMAEDGPVSYQLSHRGGRVAIESSDGRVIPWPCYLSLHESRMEHWAPKQQSLVDAGVRLFTLATWPATGQFWSNRFWALDGEPMAEPRDPKSLHLQAEYLLERAPEAHFIIRILIQPDPAWRAEHLDEFPPLRQVGGLGQDGHSIMPSTASEPSRRLTRRCILDAIAYCERLPWHDRIIGYTILALGEGATEPAINGDLFDTSEPMQEAFRRHVRAQYEDDKALREAWADDAITLGTVTVPTIEQWRAKRDTAGLMHWPEPAQTGRERDYFMCARGELRAYWRTVLDALEEATAARPVLTGADAFKQHLQGWLLHPDFRGKWRIGELDDYGLVKFASGSFDVADMLDHPAMDMLQTPGMYMNRAMGYAWESEGLSDALTLRGKVNFMEADMRTWINNRADGTPRSPDTLINDAGAFMRPSEMRAGFDRTLAWALSRNQMFYYMSVASGNWWYQDEKMVGKIRQQVDLIERVNEFPWRETTDAICVVIDDSAGLWEDFSSGYQSLAVYRQIEEGLALCGVPYRIHLLEDLGRENMPDYKCYLFPNLFRVDDQVEALLRRKVFRNGNVAIFGPGTGITDGTTRSAVGASRLLGVEMDLIPNRTSRRVMLQDHGHPVSSGLPSLVYGDSYAYGPILAPKTQRFDPAETRATILGSCFLFYFFDRPGLFVNDFGRGGASATAAGRRDELGEDDYAVVFSPAVPLPPELLRACARYAGCHMWVEENAVVYAAENFVALHTARSGEHVIHLPRRTSVWDLSRRERHARWTSRIRLDVEAPATFLFALGADGAALCR